jgi:plasmid stability protein
MKSLHIRNLDEGILLGLKARAERHHRSVQKEVEVLLRDAARMVHIPPAWIQEAGHLSTSKQQERSILYEVRLAVTEVLLSD